jgi:Undecaprenyl-phosphate glucose phosphotransferase
MPFDRSFSAQCPGPGRRALRRRAAPAFPTRHARVARALLSTTAAASDAGAIVLAAVAAGAAWHAMFYEAAGMWESHVALGGVAATLFVTIGVLRRDYEVARILSKGDRFARLAKLWNIAFVSLALLVFAAKAGAEVSRGAAVVTYVAGLAALWAERAVVARVALAHAAPGAAAARRVFLVGCEDDVRRADARLRSPDNGVEIVGLSVLRGDDSLDDDLALAAAMARVLRPDDIHVLVPWSRSNMIEAAVDAFLRLPAALHLGSGRVLERFPKARVERLGGVASLALAPPPLGLLDTAAKRALDILGAGAALILLSPLMLAVAVAIRLDSPGPALFRQRRYGFNQEPFDIFKFRSMATMENGRAVVQARADDPRVTRVGRFIRRTNIDELPQLLNVLIGDMSLVGPRPHAMAHDQQYERDIALYGRRHNVQPGISGWAQVNGFRGETQTPDKMRGRVEHDLQYIDKWSILLDLKIMFLTVFSGKAYRNA